jgi:hypothetical protein
MASTERTRLSAALEKRLAHVLAANRRHRDPVAEPRNRSPWLKPLQRWQAERLAKSFADFVASEATRPGAEFFLTDLYGDHDVTARDRGVERVMPMMKKLMPPELLATAADAIELAVLSHAFDLRVAEALDAMHIDPRQPLRTEDYAEAYRRAGKPRLRDRQVDLVTAIGDALDQAVRKPWLSRLLRISRFPARAAGLGDLQAFLERGFAAFHAMADAPAFMQAIAARERDASARIFAGSADPFRFKKRQANSRSSTR